MIQKPKKKRGPALNTAGRVTAEMAKIYRMQRRGEITPEQYKLWNDGLSKMRETKNRTKIAEYVPSEHNCPKPPDARRRHPLQLVGF